MKSSVELALINKGVTLWEILTSGLVLAKEIWVQEINVIIVKKLFITIYLATDVLLLVDVKRNLVGGNA